MLCMGKCTNKKVTANKANMKILTPLEKSKMIPTLTEEDIKIALGEDQVKHSLINFRR